MSPTNDQVMAGQAVYSKRMLGFYDFLVLGVSNRFIWKCPTKSLLRHYDRHVSANHLDVGVGTGYFLDRCRFPSPTPRIGLFDLNQNALDHTSARIQRYSPETYRGNILEPLEIEAPKFDSVGVNYLLHCIPGNIASKAAAFDHLKAVMTPDALLFGSTLLHGGVSRGRLAKRLMKFYNGKGIFANEADHLDGLTAELRKRFTDVSVDVVGCVALFSARGTTN